MNETTMINAIVFDGILIFLVLVGLIISIAMSDGANMRDDRRGKRNAKND